MENKFDKTKFVVNFDSVLTNKKMGAAFYKFLKSELNSEGYDFLVEVKNLESIKDEKHQIEMSKKIFSTFLATKAAKEVNISGELRDRTISNFEKQNAVPDKWILKQTPSEIFHECFQVVSNILRHDPFKRFIRTDECEKIMKIYQNHSSVVSPVIANHFCYKISDFKHPYIDDKDFDFFKALMEDGYNWKVRKI
jgi:hypothetical protein